MKQSIDDKHLDKVKNLYYRESESMRTIGERFGVSVDAVVYFMRKHNLKRRTFSEISRISFEKKKPSFLIRKKLSEKDKGLMAVGAMLYWAEGYKGNEDSDYCSVDFANSDPDMIRIFMTFLRRIFGIDEKRLRVLLYCYADQDIRSLVQYWSKLTSVPVSQFSKPYVREDFKSNGRKMAHGMVHIRYSDKKLLIEIKKLIDCYRRKYAPVG